MPFNNAQMNYVRLYGKEVNLSEQKSVLHSENHVSHALNQFCVSLLYDLVVT